MKKYCEFYTSLNRKLTTMPTIHRKPVIDGYTIILGILVLRIILMFGRIHRTNTRLLDILHLTHLTLVCRPEHSGAVCVSFNHLSLVCRPEPSGAVCFI